MNINEILKEKLAEKNLKVTDLSRLSGISYPYCIDLVKGRRRWNEDTIEKACKALGIQLISIDCDQPPPRVTAAG